MAVGILLFATPMQNRRTPMQSMSLFPRVKLRRRCRFAYGSGLVANNNERKGIR